MDKQVTKAKLIELLRKIDSTLDETVVLVAIGGTALSLLDLKEATHDVDFILQNNSQYIKGDLTLKILDSGYDVQIQDQGKIVLFRLPPDYLALAKPSEINSLFSNLQVYILSPIDLLVSKLSRYNTKDYFDINALLLRYRFTIEEIKNRYGQYQLLYKGDLKKLDMNFATFEKQYAETMKSLGKAH